MISPAYLSYLAYPRSDKDAGEETVAPRLVRTHTDDRRMAAPVGALALANVLAHLSRLAHLMYVGRGPHALDHVVALLWVRHSARVSTPRLRYSAVRART
jgi:hypothetical protein